MTTENMIVVIGMMLMIVVIAYFMQTMKKPGQKSDKAD